MTQGCAKVIIDTKNLVCAGKSKVLICVGLSHGESKKQDNNSGHSVALGFSQNMVLQKTKTQTRDREGAEKEQQ